MMTVNEVSKLTGVSIRTLQYYDTICLLKPIEYTESGYRLYDDTSFFYAKRACKKTLKGNGMRHNSKKSVKINRSCDL